VSWRTIFVFGLWLLLVSLVGCHQDTTVKLGRGLKPGDSFPSLEGKNIYGRPVKASDYHGKVILLNFFGDW